ncbi:type II secretion system F family protein [Marinobacterium rhizophilum]|uniref:Type II secretion system F family protein n=1 Tax=Marinobacterium rhizophilum TaxID=420402 RepID=A0ABY5HEE9_9GAMM|nr:type II secretion system F family protein [Marinobacterium rhizophilum]UTW10211.1 type II secretion system F family protein [Marinobacterium rhizophilum]
MNFSRPGRWWSSGRSGWNAAQLRSLATLLGAGIAPVQALGVMQRQFPEQAAGLGRMSRLLRGGTSLANALTQAQALGSGACQTLQAAEAAGQLDAALRQVAACAEQQYLRIRAFKARLWLPWVVLVIALLAGCLIRLQTPGASLPGVFFDLGLSLGWVALVTVLLLYLLQLDRMHWLSWGWRWKLQGTRLYALVYECHFFGLLFWALNAGIDCAQALGNASAFLRNPDYQRAVRRAEILAAGGESLTAALQQAGLVLSVEMTQLLDSAEQAGRIAPAIEHQLGILQQRLELRTQSLYEWLPRFYYLLVLGVAGRFLAG